MRFEVGMWVTCLYQFKDFLTKVESFNRPNNWHITFPSRFLTSPEVIHYQNAVQQLQLGIRDGGSGCYRNAPLIAAASYSALTVTINWLHKHPIAFSWLQQPLLQALCFFCKSEYYFPPSMESPRGYQQALLLIFGTSKRYLYRYFHHKLSLTGQHISFQRKAIFGLHIKQQMVPQFTRHLTVLQQQRFHSMAWHALQLSQSSHLLPDKTPASNLWQWSTSLLSLT